MDRRDLELLLRNVRKRSKIKPIIFLSLLLLGGYFLIKNIKKLGIFPGEITGSFIKIPSNYPIDIKLYGKAIAVVPIGIEGDLSLQKSRVHIGNTFLYSDNLRIEGFRGNFSNFTFARIVIEGSYLTSPSYSRIISNNGYTIEGRINSIIIRGFDGTIEIFGGKKKIKGYLILERFDGSLSFENGKINLNGTVTGIKIT